MSIIENGNKNCQTHQLEILAVDLKAAREQKQKYLCVKCLIERIQGNNIVLLSEAIEMIKELKNKYKDEEVKKKQETLNSVQNLQCSVSKVNDHFTQVFDKLQNKINESISSNEQEIEQKKTSFDELSLDKDIETLSQIYNGNSNCEPIKQEFNLEGFTQMLDKIQSDLSMMSNTQQFSQIFESIYQIKSQFQIGQLIPKRRFEKHETPTLKYLCSQHGKKIMMINLSQNESEQCGLACEKCIQQFPKREYITVEDANTKWKELKGQQKLMISKYNNGRYSKFNSAIKSIQQLKDIYNQTLSDIIQQLERQRNMNQSTKKDNSNVVEDIYELDEQEVLKIVEFLSQKDKNQKVKLEQQEQDQVDLIFYQNLKQNLENLVKYDLLTKHNLIRIHNQDQCDEFSITGIISENEYDRNSDSKAFIKKFSQLEQYCSIFEDSCNFYKNLQKEIDDLQEKGQLSYLFIEDQQQKQYQSFELYSKKMKSLIMVEEHQKQISTLEQELNQYKQSQQTVQAQLDESNQKIETLNSKIDQLNQQITQLQKDKSQLNESNQSLNKQIEELKQQITKAQKESSEQLNQKNQEINSLQQFQQLLRDQPKLITPQFYVEVSKLIEEKSKMKIQCSFLTYLGTRDGLNHTKCWSKINGKKNLLIIYKSKSGNIFGAYSPCQWIEKQNGYVPDDTLSSFLFSQTHNQFYPIKEANKAHAIYRHQSYGPSFGQGYDIYIGSDFTSGSSALGTAYQIDQYQIQDTTTHLFGQTTPNLEECEILELILK
ncbi:unnamed protein product (macronuclear) [Paramecium tetraurelia]|uniref:TLDc domain-containing protein n=1 Tax=Paramecium tetraurelia TaxID=5888 RepID=A0BXZ8_PARTE|nr:uncharacterized protein GSPATT00033268001 [Paramecium tetraurelia]CAK63415.1 unnamed protein product [Paramecium tetraurelia]|eukprot:XP_001430813.1 hypothetical protein (macronuclear) [Paramecium tetraurelia strain d4-2]